MSEKIFLKDITLPITETGENETYYFVQTDADLEKAGDAADAKKTGDEITKLKQDLNSIGVKQLNFIEAVGCNYYNPETVTVGSYIDNTGNVASNPSYAVTDFIPVKPGDVVRYTLVNGISDQHSQLYNLSKTWVQTTRFIKTNYDGYQQVTIPNGISYIRVNFLASDTASYIVTINQDYDASLAGTYGYNLSLLPEYKLTLDDVEELKTSVNNITPYQLDFLNVEQNLFDPDTLSSGYLDNEGNVVSSTSYMFTDFIPVNGGDKVRFTYNGGVASQSCQYYDNNKQFYVTGRFVTTVIDSTYQESTVPQSAKYIRINLGVGQINDFVVVKNKPYDKDLGGNADVVMKLKDGYAVILSGYCAKNQVPNPFLFDNICCIGDSLTEGQNGSSYPLFLARFLNCDTTNLGLSGMSTKTWWENKDTRFTQEQLDYSDYDCFILFFGTNGGLDGNADPSEDSMLGYYCKIVESIRTLNTDAPIFLIVSPWTQNRDSYGLENWITQIEKVASEYSLPVLRLDESKILTYTNKAVNQPFDGGLHYGRLGYLRFASEINRCITEVIENTPSDYA